MSLQSAESSSISAKPTSAVYNAIVAILEEQSTAPSQCRGVGVRSISNYLQSRDNGRYSRKYVEQLIEREAAQNKIVKVSDDSFTLPKHTLVELDRRWRRERDLPENDRKTETEKGRQAKSEKTSTPTTPKPERVGQRMKRAKKVFDPSDIDVPPTKRRGRPVGSGKKQPISPQRKPIPVVPVKKPVMVHETIGSPRVTPPPAEVSVKVEKLCRLCQGDDTTPAGEKEDLISCRTCNVSVHPSCLGFDQKLSSVVREKHQWFCPDCRPCFLCKAIKDDEDTVLCSGCDTVFHCCCLDPKPDSYPEGLWLCTGCKQEAQLPTGLHSNHPPAVTTANIGLWMFATHQLELKGPPLTCPWPDASDEPDSSGIPDASGWTVDDVQKYFSDVGLGHHARVFKDQDVDGTSLLLLKRDDVVHRMGLKLGPALKIYRHVRHLQMAV